MTTPPLDPRAVEGLQQVRTAYRLVHAYHRRLLDLLLLAKEAVAQSHGPLRRTWWGRTAFNLPPRGAWT